MLHPRQNKSVGTETNNHIIQKHKAHNRHYYRNGRSSINK